MEDIYECFLKPEYTIENIKDFSFIKLNKEMKKLNEKTKKNFLTDYQMNQLVLLNKELKDYDDKYKNEKKRERDLLNKSFKQLNKELLKYMNENYEKLTSDYRMEHKEKQRKYMNVKITCECGETLCQGNMSRHKTTDKHIKFLENPSLINEPKPVISQEERKKKYNEYMTDKISCECGKQVSRANMSKHKKTEKHKEKIDSINIKE